MKSTTRFLLAAATLCLAPVVGACGDLGTGPGEFEVSPQASMSSAAGVGTSPKPHGVGTSPKPLGVGTSPKPVK